MSELLRPGGPLNIRRFGPSTYDLSVPIPADSQGLHGRECPADECSPGYFKIRLGTGVTTPGYQACFCPYCRFEGLQSDFPTEAQKNHAMAVLGREATEGVARMLRDQLSGRRTSRRGLLSIEMTVEAKPNPVPARPAEEVLRRDVTCPHCTLEHAVFGMATWCPDCGRDIFLAHVRREFEVIGLMLDDVPGRKDRLGARIAARDLENTLEDVVSIFEAVLKQICRRALARSLASDQVEAALRRIGNAFQNINRAERVLTEHLGEALATGLPASDVARLDEIFQKRHPITHNLGVVDRKFLTQVRSSEQPGREVLVTEEEVRWAVSTCLAIISDVFGRSIGSATP